MITLPEFEEEKMEIVAEQNETMITIVEEMQRLSERLDSVEKRFRNLNISEKKSKKHLLSKKLQIQQKSNHLLLCEKLFIY